MLITNHPDKFYVRYEPKTKDDADSARVKQKSAALTVFGVKSSKMYKFYLSKITARIININRASKLFNLSVFLNHSIELSNFFRPWLMK